MEDRTLPKTGCSPPAYLEIEDDLKKVTDCVEATIDDLVAKNLVSSPAAVDLYGGKPATARDLFIQANKTVDVNKVNRELMNKHSPIKAIQDEQDGIAGEKRGGLVLSRYADDGRLWPGQKDKSVIHVGPDIEIHVVKIMGQQVKLRIVAPESVTIVRGEHWVSIDKAIRATMARAEASQLLDGGE